MATITVRLGQDDEQRLEALQQVRRAASRSDLLREIIDHAYRTLPARPKKKRKADDHAGHR